MLLRFILNCTSNNGEELFSLNEQSERNPDITATCTQTKMLPAVALDICRSSASATSHRYATPGKWKTEETHKTPSKRNKNHNGVPLKVEVQSNVYVYQGLHMFDASTPLHSKNDTRLGNTEHLISYHTPKTRPKDREGDHISNAKREFIASNAF